VRPKAPAPERAPASAPSPREPSRLVAALAAVCAELPLAEKILVTPSLAVGHQLVERLARAGHRPVQLRVQTIRTLALARVGVELAREGRKLLSRAQALALVEQSCGEVLRKDSYFGALKDRPGLHRAVQNALDELRAAGSSPADLPLSAFADPRKPRELAAIRARYEKALEETGWIDRAEILNRALQKSAGAERPRQQTVYLVPDDLDLPQIERQFLESLSGGAHRSLETDGHASWGERARTARFVRALGEENEVRSALRDILSSGTPFDEAELLYADPSIYPALVFEIAAEHGIPCTFASGVAASYTRPGRAALAFFAWIGSGYETEILRRALASGDFGPGAEAEVGFVALARVIRNAEIGWGRNRYGTALDRLVAELSSPTRAREDEAPEEREIRENRRIRKLTDTIAAREFVKQILAGIPEGPACPLSSLARAAKGFLDRFGRTANELDGIAASALTKLFSEFEALDGPPLAIEEGVRRLADAVRALHVAADRPRPGRIHVSDFQTGGFSGRTATWIVGLDERRHPGRTVDDPVLSDEERRRINESMNLGLALGGGRSEKRSRAMRACVARLRGALTFSYSGWNVRNLVQAGEVFPSPFVLEAFRQREDRAQAGYEELTNATSPPAGFVPEVSRDLDEGEWWLARIDRAGFRGPAMQAGLLALHPWLADAARAREARKSPAFTIWDGSIGEPAPDADPRRNRRPMSSSRLRRLAECPFGFFLREVLGIESPSEDERDPGRWLDPLALGKLLHEVFHRFHQELAREGLKPTVAAHRGLIESIAEDLIREWREVLPPRSELAFRNAREEILFACRTFLQLEEVHCREVTPKFFELAFGLSRGGSDSALSSPEPVEISLGGGRSFLLRGSIDRVDEDSDGNFHVWDYKTGSLWSIKEDSTLRGGRQMQHALYSLALESLLARAGCGGRVVRAGYFFPGRRGEGQRLAVPDSPAETRRLLDGLFDLVAAGQFPHSPDPGDCKYCEFVEVCGSAKQAALQSKEKIAASTDPLFRTLMNRDD